MTTHRRRCLRRTPSRRNNPTAATRTRRRRLPMPSPHTQSQKKPESSNEDPAAPPPIPSAVKPAPAPASDANGLGQLRAMYRKAADRYNSMDSYIVRLKRHEQINGKDKPEEM